MRAYALHSLRCNTNNHVALFTASNLINRALIRRLSRVTASTMASAADRLNISSQLEHLQSRHVGTGHADATRHEWAVNIHRDSYASYVGHHPMVSYFAVANGESIGRTKYDFTQKMLLPCGLPPEVEEE